MVRTKFCNLLTILGVLCQIGFPVSAHAEKTSDEIFFDGSHLEQSVTLTGQQTHPVYEDRVIPKTCYKDELIGYERECHMEDRQQCETHYEKQCYPITRRECTPTTRRECHTETRTECTPITRRECSQERVCEDVPEQVCRTDAQGNQHCRTVIARRCHTENQCRDVSDRVCRSYPEQVCNDVRDEICHDVSDTECRDIPRETCHPVSEQVCNDVPQYRQVAYDCSTTEQVYLRDELDFNVTANVIVDFQIEDVSTTPREKFKVSLNGERIDLSLIESSDQYLVLIDKLDTKVSTTAPKEKKIESNIKVKLISIDALKAPIERNLLSIERFSSKELILSSSELKYPSLFGIETNIKKGSSTVLLNVSNVSSLNYESPRAGFSTFTLDFAKLELPSVIQRGVKYKVGLRLFVKQPKDGSLLNPKLLPKSLEITRLISIRSL